MSRETRFEERITTSDEFSNTLRALLLAGHTNGIDVSGAWEIRSDGSTPDWEAMIVELGDGEGGEAATDRGTNGTAGQ